jgi:cell wall-associated NlpC family hydrolase
MSKRSYRNYIGIPFKERGRDFSGVDCYGIVVLVYKEELGIKLWDTASYDLKDHTHSKDNLMLSNYYKDWKPVNKEEAQELDILMFTMDDELQDIPNHIALYLGENKLLHCMSGHPTYTCKFVKGPLERFFHSAYRYKGKDS